MSIGRATDKRLLGALVLCVLALAVAIVLALDTGHDLAVGTAVLALAVIALALAHRRSVALALDAVEAERRRLELVINATGAGTWEWDLDDGRTRVNLRWAQILGYDSLAEFGETNLTRWRERVHPDDLERVEAVLVAGTGGAEPGYVCEYRLRHRDGHWLWVHDRGQVVLRDRTGRPLRMAGIYLEVTERVERDHQLGTIAEALTRPHDVDLLDTLVRTARDLTAASHAFVAAIDADGASARVVAAVPAGSALSGATLPIAACHPGRGETWRVDLCAEAREAGGLPLGAVYIGRRLGSGDGATEGLFGLAFDEPAGATERAQQVLGILATAATHELARERSALALRESEERYRRIYETMPVMLLTLDAARVIVDVNEAFLLVTGNAAPACLGRRVEDFFGDACDKRLAALLDEGSSSPAPVLLELPHARHGTRTVSATVFGGGRLGSNDLRILALEDVTERLRAEREIERLAFHDPLTALPNRRYLLERLGPAMAAARRRGTLGALLFIDLDHFKEVNDGLGHTVGDGVLVEVGRRLRELTRREDVVSRLGGDEFIVLLSEVGADADTADGHAASAAQKIADELSRPYAVDGHDIRLTPTIGIALFPGQHDSAGALLDAADAAMYEGKVGGRNTQRLFRGSGEGVAGSRTRLEQELRAAFERDQFELHFQPQVQDARGVTVIGAEALLRWRHPLRGLLAAEHFLPAVADGALGQRLGEWMIARALATLARWRAEGLVGIEHLALRLAPRHFRARDFVERLTPLLEGGAGLACELVLELDERCVAADADAAAARLHALGGHGCRFALVDFGVGHAALGYLRHLPLDHVKLDSALVAELPADPQAALITETVLTLARQLGLPTVAAGVENGAQRDFLRALGCAHYQGGLFCPAVDEDDFLRYRASVSAC